MGILKKQGCVETDKTLKAFFCLDFFFQNQYLSSWSKLHRRHNANNPVLHLINSEAQAHIYWLADLVNWLSSDVAPS